MTDVSSQRRGCRPGIVQCGNRCLGVLREEGDLDGAGISSGGLAGREDLFGAPRVELPFGLLLGEPLHELFAVDERDAVAFDELLGKVRPDDHDGSHPADVDSAGVEFALQLHSRVPERAC